MFSHWPLIATLLPFASAQCTVSTQCSTYLSTSVADMRRASGSGCFELAHVVVAARTPSATAPRVYVQDAAGGDFSAIRAKCDASPTHACPPETAHAVQRLLDGSQVTIRGYYLQGSLSGFEEIYLDQVRDEGTFAELPPPASLALGDLARGARARSAWFQVVTANVAPEDPLVMYDMSPAELAHAQRCPAYGGFGVIPTSLASVAGAADCVGATNPAGVIDPDARELLIGREFFKEFFASSDCACAVASKQHLLTATSSLIGPIRGVLTPEIKPGSSALFQVFHPLSRSGFPILGG